MELFYIDNAFSPSINVDVENGIVINCSNSYDSMINALNEKYKGRTITQLRDEHCTFYAERNVWVIVRSRETLPLLKRRVKYKTAIHWKGMDIHELNGRLKSLKIGVDRHNNKESRIKECELQIKYAEEIQVDNLAKFEECEKEMIIEKERLLKTHNFVYSDKPFRLSETKVD